MEIKKHIRKKVIDQRSQLNVSEKHIKSNRIFAAVKQNECYKKAEHILLYMDYLGEVETGLFLEDAWERKKRVYCPKVAGDELHFFEVFSKSDFTEGYQGILEPNSLENRYQTDCNHKSVIIVPGVAFDRKRNRIGYGKGFYDRFLQKHLELYKIAVCFECQMVEHIEADIHDVKPDILYTEKGKQE